MFRKEEHALVLDFLPSGRAGEARQEPTAQVVGDQYFTLLELITKPGVQLKAGDKVYIGREVREQIERIKRRILYTELTNAAAQELERVVKDVVRTREADFVGFMNKAGPVNIRLHALELLPNVGKKNLEALLAEREKGPFASFEDIRVRVAHLTNIEEIFCHRILAELKGEEKYYLFVKIPPKEDEMGERRDGGYRDRRDGFGGDRGGYGGERRGGYGARDGGYNRPRY